MQSPCFQMILGLALLLPSAIYGAPEPGCSSAPYSSLGCEFYAVSLPNTLLDQTTFAFGVDLLNAGPVQANVSISGGGLGSPLAFAIAAGANNVTTLPWVPALSMSNATVKIAGGAYHIVTSAPVSAVQLNPTSAVAGMTDAFVGDASLLLAATSAGTEFRALTWPTWNSGSAQETGHVAVIGLAGASATVTVSAAGTIQPGAGLTSSGGTVSLGQSEVLLIASAADAPPSGTGSDLSGLSISSTAPVLVFSGHAEAQVPNNVSYTDHLEEVVLPNSALGQHYFVVRPGNPTGAPTGAAHLVKIASTAVDDTHLTTNPVIAGAPATLPAGAVVMFPATADFELQTDRPVAVATFMEGGSAFGSSGPGDPAQSIVVPWNQARRSIDFAAPASIGPAWAQIVARSGATILLDGSPVTGWTAIGSSGYVTANVALCCSDAHHAAGNRAFTLSVYSYPDFAAYWYPAAIGFEEIFADGFD